MAELNHMVRNTMDTSEEGAQLLATLCRVLGVRKAIYSRRLRQSSLLLLSVWATPRERVLKPSRGVARTERDSAWRLPEAGCPE